MGLRRFDVVKAIHLDREERIRHLLGNTVLWEPALRPPPLHPLSLDRARDLVAKEAGDLPDLPLSPLERIPLIARDVVDGEVRDELIYAWRVAESSDGYSVVLAEDGSEFGIAGRGFDTDKHLVLEGWYGNLASTWEAL